jgi:hypothetical protein
MKPKHGISFLIAQQAFLDPHRVIIPATKDLNFRHSSESWNPLRKLDAGSSPA